MSNDFLLKIKAFWKRYDRNILVVLAIVVTAIVSFRFGQTQESYKKTADIKVELTQPYAYNPREEKIKALGEAVYLQEGENVAMIESATNQEGNKEQLGVECAFVGSKNSNKYHLPSCSSAKKIKQENIVCFSSKEDAESKGYEPASCCVNKK